jgi:hypothetical protein
VYGTGIIPCTKVQTVTDINNIVLSKDALQTGTFNLTYTDSNPGKYLEQCEILTAVESCAMEEGKLIEIVTRGEAGITRGKYNSIRTKQQTPSLFIYAVDMQYGPGVKTLEKAGLRQESDVICKTPAKTWIDAGYEFADIENGLIRYTVKVDDETYEIKEVSKEKQCNSIWLWWNLGLFKK